MPQKKVIQGGMQVFFSSFVKRGDTADHKVKVTYIIAKGVAVLNLTALRPAIEE